jgi:prepilin-type N-terminal cleavage/methylation domain-containing protein/prepilin-type processing-associated H-X9-DG protein
MRPLWHNRKARAFTLVEMLVVIAIIAILAALLLPVLMRGKQSAQRIECVNNLQEIGTAFQIFAHDHRGQFPMQTPIAEGGSMELVQAGLNINGTFYFSYRHLQTLANELVTPRVLVCPSDLAREVAPNFSLLRNSNVSYFVGAYADYNAPQTVLAGDRNITNSAGATASLVRGSYNLRWTSEIHAFKGNVLFSDSHVEQKNNDHLTLPAVAAANSVYFLPAVNPPGVSSPGGSPPGGSSPGGSSPGGSSPGVSSPGNSPSGGAPGTTVVRDGQPAGAPPSLTPQARGDSDAPAPSSPAPRRNNTTGSSSFANRGNESDPSLFNTHARETNGIAVTSDAKPATAPAIQDEPEPPLLWLLGTARSLVAKASWWLWLLLAALIAAALYLYSHRKKRDQGKR